MPADVLTRLEGRINDAHMDAERLMDDAIEEIKRLRKALADAEFSLDCLYYEAMES